VDLARNLPGVIGSRMTGGGFGGCTVSLVWADAASGIVQALRESYQRQTNIEPGVFMTRPAQGAQILSAAVAS
jgi:galactokinase